MSDIQPEDSEVDLTNTHTFRTTLTDLVKSTNRKVDSTSQEMKVIKSTLVGNKLARPPEKGLVDQVEDNTDNITEIKKTDTKRIGWVLAAVSAGLFAVGKMLWEMVKN